MKGFIEKLIGRLEEESYLAKPRGRSTTDYGDTVVDIGDAIDIVNQLAEEYINISTDTSSGWIACSERLPEEHDSMFAEYKGTDKWRSGMFEKISDDVNATIEYENSTRKTKTIHTVDGVWKIDSIVKGEVIAWQPLPAPYKEGE